MDVQELTVVGALQFVPTVFHDHRGLFVSPLQGPAFVKARSVPLFRVAQMSHSRTRKGVIRGVHFTRTPPGTAKYVYCMHGRALDILVDLRVGSPTFGRWDATVLDDQEFRALYIPVGVGHAFVALVDDTKMSYLLSGSYVPENELAVSPLDPELALPIPDGLEPILSERDRVADTLAIAAERGLLPDYDRCRSIDARLTSATE